MSLPAEVRAEIWGTYIQVQPVHRLVVPADISSSGYLLDGDYVRGFFHMARPEHECVRVRHVPLPTRHLLRFRDKQG